MGAVAELPGTAGRQEYVSAVLQIGNSRSLFERRMKRDDITLEGNRGVLASLRRPPARYRVAANNKLRFLVSEICAIGHATA